MFYVYVYLDPRYEGTYNYGDIKFNYKPFYIGKGKGIRCYRSLQPNRIAKEKKTFKRNYLKKLQSLNVKPIVIKLYENLTEDAAFKREIELISLIGRRKYNEGPLVNLSEGGDGCSGFTMPQTARDKISKAHKDIPLSKEHKKNLSESLKGREVWNTGLKIPYKARKPLTKEERGLRAKEYKFISPDGKFVSIKLLKDFCEEHKLSISQMRRLAKGKISEYKQYKRV